MGSEHVGAFGIGYAIALLLVSDPWRRVLVGSLLAIPAVYTIDITTAGVICAGLVAVVTLWWLRRLAQALPSPASPWRTQAADAGAPNGARLT